MTISRKASPYIIEGTTAPLRRPDAAPTLVVLVDCSVAYHREVRAMMGPDVLILWRKTEPNDYQPLDDPERRADQWWERRKGEILAIPADDNTVVAGYNEKPDAQAGQFVRFERRRLAHLHAAGRRAAVGSFSVGTPNEGVWEIYALLREYMQAGDVWDVHEYASDYADLDNRWHVGRFTLPAIAPHMGDWPIVVSEFGYDYTPDTGKGWPGWQLQPGANDETALAMIRKGGQFYDSQPRVIGFALYQMGSRDPKFYAFNMWGVWPSVVAEYDSAPVATPNLPEPPDSSPQPQPQPSLPLSLVPPIRKADIVRITQRFTPPTHYGIDFSCYEGTPVYASCDGIAYRGSQPSGFGLYVRVEDGGGLYVYAAHLRAWAVADGALVQAGDLIGYSGNTGNSSGPHLHYEVRRAAPGAPRPTSAQGAIDPEPLIYWPEDAVPEPGPEPLPIDEQGPPGVLAQKARWWCEEMQRQFEAGNLDRAQAIRLSLIDLLYRLENDLR